MKNLKKLAVRIAIAFVLLTAVVIVIETQTGANKALAGSNTYLCGVYNSQCINYLIQREYTNVTVIGYDGCNRICDTSNSYHTVVEVSNGIITGSHDMPN